MRLPLGTIARGGDDLRQYLNSAVHSGGKLRHVATTQYDNALLALAPLGQLAHIHKNATSMFSDGPRLEDKIEKLRRDISGEGVEESMIRPHPLAQLAYIHEKATSMFADGPNLEAKIEDEERDQQGGRGGEYDPPSRGIAIPHRQQRRLIPISLIMVSWSRGSARETCMEQGRRTVLVKLESVLLPTRLKAGKKDDKKADSEVEVEE